MPEIELVGIPAGEFMMGSNHPVFVNERPVHKVTIREEFWMGKYEITQAQYQAVMGTNPSYFKNCANCPVEQVSWNDAKEFIRRLNVNNDKYTYSLPSEAEWEYAARAGTTGDFYGNLDSIAWYSSNSEKATHPIGQKQANNFGLYDMTGNVFEMCEDIYNEKGYVNLPVDGSPNLSVGDSTRRVVRGGSWFVGDGLLRSAKRFNISPTSKGNETGFRVVARPR